MEKEKVNPKTMLNLQKLKEKRRRNKEKQMLTKMKKMVMKKEVTDKLKRRRKEIAKKRLLSFMLQGNKIILISECLVTGLLVIGNKP